ncbi:MAG TPA: hypothetical protein VFH82_09725, partial [Gemmatimonadota bacterium]|nr:hypothetical protein [Gemmatimonadota bacterium]
MTRENQGLSLKSLKPVEEHRTVDFLENIHPYIDPTVRTNAENVPVVRCMVELAERQPVRDDRVSLRVLIGKDVRRVEEFSVAKPADRTAFPISPQHAFAEPGLMEPVAGLDRNIGSTSIGALVPAQRSSRE